MVVEGAADAGLLTADTSIFKAFESDVGVGLMFWLRLMPEVECRC